MRRPKFISPLHCHLVWSTHICDHIPFFSLLDWIMSLRKPCRTAVWRESLGRQAEAHCVVISHDVTLSASSGFHSGLHMPGLPCSHTSSLFCRCLGTLGMVSLTSHALSTFSGPAAGVSFCFCLSQAVLCCFMRLMGKIPRIRIVPHGVPSLQRTASCSLSQSILRRSMCSA